MAAGLGEATAIIAVLQAGLSLATTLKAYVDAYHDAPDDIKHLASDLESTMRYASELKDMLEENKRIPALNDNGVAEAKTCLQQADEIVKTLMSLIRKGSKHDLPSGGLKVEDLDTTKFQQVVWFLYKGSFATVNAAMHNLQTRIVLFLALYRSKTSSSPLETDLYKTQLVAVDYVLENGDVNALNGPPAPPYPSETGVQLPQRHAHFGDLDPSGNRSRDVAVRDPKAEGGGPPNQFNGAPAPQNLPPGMNGVPAPPLHPTAMQVYNARPVVTQRFVPIDQLERDLELKFHKRLLAKQDEEEAAQKEKEKAQAEYRDGLVKQLAERKRKMQEAKERLLRIFGEGLPPDKIEAYLTEQNAAQDVSEDLFNFITDVVNNADNPPAADGTGVRAPGSNGVAQTNMGVQSVWGFGLTSRLKQIGTNGANKSPEFLAFILAERSREWTMTQADVPRSVLKLLKRSIRGNGTSAQEVLQTTLKVFSTLNSKCLRMLESWLARQRAEHNLVWGLSYACAWFSSRRRGLRYRALRALAASEPVDVTMNEEPAESLLLVFRLLDVVKNGRKPGEGGWQPRHATHPPGSATTPPDTISGTFGRKTWHDKVDSSSDGSGSSDLDFSELKRLRRRRRSRSRSQLRYSDGPEDYVRSRSRERARRAGYSGLDRSRSYDRWDEDVIERRPQPTFRDRSHRFDDPYGYYSRRDERNRSVLDYDDDPYTSRERSRGLDRYYNEYYPYAPRGPRAEPIETIERDIFIGHGPDRRVVREVEEIRRDRPRPEYLSRERERPRFEEEDDYDSYRRERPDRVIEIERDRPIRRDTFETYASRRSDDDPEAAYRKNSYPPPRQVEREEIIIRREPGSSADAGKLIIRERGRDSDSHRQLMRERERSRERRRDRDRERFPALYRDPERERDRYDDDDDIYLRTLQRDIIRERSPSPPPPPNIQIYSDNIMDRRSSQTARHKRHESPRRRSNFRSNGGNVLVREREKEDGKDEVLGIWTQDGKDISNILKGMEGGPAVGKELVPYEPSFAAARITSAQERKQKQQQQTPPQRKESGNIMDDKRSQAIVDKYWKQYTLDTPTATTAAPPVPNASKPKSEPKAKSGLATVVEDAPNDTEESQANPGAKREPTSSGGSGSGAGTGTGITTQQLFSEPESEQDLFIAAPETLDQEPLKPAKNTEDDSTQKKKP